MPDLKRKRVIDALPLVQPGNHAGSINFNVCPPLTATAAIDIAAAAWSQRAPASESAGTKGSPRASEMRRAAISVAMPVYAAQRSWSRLSRNAA